MWELTKRISWRILSVLCKVEPELDLYTGSGSDQKVPAPDGSATLNVYAALWGLSLIMTFVACLLMAGTSFPHPGVTVVSWRSWCTWGKGRVWPSTRTSWTPRRPAQRARSWHQARAPAAHNTWEQCLTKRGTRQFFSIATTKCSGSGFILDTYSGACGSGFVFPFKSGSQ